MNELYLRRYVIAQLIFFKKRKYFFHDLLIFFETWSLLKFCNQDYQNMSKLFGRYWKLTEICKTLSWTRFEQKNIVLYLLKQLKTFSFSLTKTFVLLFLITSSKLLMTSIMIKTYGESIWWMTHDREFPGSIPASVKHFFPYARWM